MENKVRALVTLAVLVASVPKKTSTGSQHALGEFPGQAGSLWTSAQLCRSHSGVSIDDDLVAM